MNAHVCGALIQACLSARDPLRAAKVYERAIRERFRLEPRTCQHLIRCLLSAAHTVKAVSLLRTMTGIHGANSSPPTASNPGLGAFDEGFLAEVLATLAA